MEGGERLALVSEGSGVVSAGLDGSCALGGEPHSRSLTVKAMPRAPPGTEAR